MIVAGLGFRTRATAEDLHTALSMALPDGVRPEALATIRRKAHSPAFQDLARALALPILALPATDLFGTETRTQSQKMLKMFGTGSMAEAAAILGAGQNAKLLALRIATPNKMATAAIARGDGP